MSKNTLEPIFNEVPFKKVKLPEDLYSFIMEEYKKREFDQIDQCIEYSTVYDCYTSAGISIRGSDQPYCLKTDISTELYEKCYDVITPIIEEWSGQRLQKTWGYGIRHYVHDSVLHLHRDLIQTHILSCIIFIDQKSDKNWPLDFFDHEHNHHKVYFEPGDMLLYESLCVHGRLEPFRGEYYRSMYFHWKPMHWSYDKYEDLKVEFKDEHEFRNYYRRSDVYDTRRERTIPRNI